MQTETNSFLADLKEYEHNLAADSGQLPVLLKLDLKRNTLLSYSISDTGLVFTFGNLLFPSRKTILTISDCCEHAYADWLNAKPSIDQDFKPSSSRYLEILGVNGEGFIVRLSYLLDRLYVFVPCYSDNLSLTVEYGGAKHTVDLQGYTKSDIG